MFPSGPNRGIRLVAFWSLALALLGAPVPAANGKDADSEPELARRAPLAVLHQTQMDFGTLADHDGWVEMDWQNRLVYNPDHLSMDFTAVSAVFVVTGDPSTNTTVSITGGTTEGLTISDFTTDWGDPPIAGFRLDGTGEQTIRIGARLTVDSSVATNGPKAISYTFSVVAE
mgnify:CR=1 FL=1